MWAVKLFTFHSRSNFADISWIHGKPLSFEMTHVSRPGLGDIQAVSLESREVRQKCREPFGVVVF